MKKTIVLTLGFIFLLLTLPVKADETLQQIQKQIINPDVLCGLFTQKRQFADIHRTIQSNGRFCMHKQKGILWKTLSPINTTLLITQDEMIQYRGQEIVGRMSASREPFVKFINTLVLSLTSGDFSELEKYFDIKASLKNGNWEAHLVAKDTIEKALRSVSIRGDRSIKYILIDEQSNNKTAITFTNIEVGIQSLHPDEIRLYE